MLDVPAYRIEPIVGSYYFAYMEKPIYYGELGAHIEGLTSWKQFEPALIALQVAGLELDKWTSRDDAESYTRIFEQADYFEERIGVRLYATLTGDTEECKRIFVGYESRQPSYYGGNPIYKLECKE